MWDFLSKENHRTWDTGNDRNKAGNIIRNVSGFCFLLALSSLASSIGNASIGDQK